MASGHFTPGIEAEILSVTTGDFENRSYVIISFRIEPDSFECMNLAIKPEQAVRLMRDLTLLGWHSKVMKEAVKNTEDHFESFKRIAIEGELQTHNES